MPTWDKSKAREWYEKNKDELRVKRRRQRLEQKKKVRDHATVSSKRA